MAADRRNRCGLRAVGPAACLRQRLAEGESRSALGEALAEIAPQLTFGATAQARTATDLLGHARLVLDLVGCEPLGSRDLGEIAAGLQPIAMDANRGEAVGVIRVLAGVSQGQGRAVVEDDPLDIKAGATISAAVTSAGRDAQAWPALSRRPQ